MFNENGRRRRPHIVRQNPYTLRNVDMLRPSRADVMMGLVSGEAVNLVSSHRVMGRAAAVGTRLTV